MPEDSQQQSPKLTPTEGAEGRLDSWKEIAAYLKRSVRTVQRWEREEGLTVHRRGSAPNTRNHEAYNKANNNRTIKQVFAYRSEIDAWWGQFHPALANRTVPLWWRPGPAWLTAAIAILVVLIGLVWWVKPDFFAANEPRLQTPTRFVITPPPGAPLASHGSIDVVISADGKRVAYVAQHDDTTQLYVRPLDEFEARPIPGTEGARSFPFFSPDGEWLGFSAAGKLKKVSFRGEAPLTLCEVGSLWTGGGWNSQGTIIFAAREKTGPGGLYRVAATGGAPKSVATPDPEKGESKYTCPKFLPDGKALFFDVSLVDAASSPQIRVLSLETGEQKIVVEEGVNAYYAPTGHLLYQSKSGSLTAAPFDLETLAVTGNSVVIRGGIRGVDYTFSRDGTLVYVPGDDGLHTLVLVDRQGKERVVSQKSRAYYNPRISPDGRQVALTIGEEGKANVWIYDLEEDWFRRLTFEGEQNSGAVWAPDGKWVTFVSNRDGPNSLYRKWADGNSPAERLTTSQFGHFQASWSPDGGVLAFAAFNSGGSDSDIWILPSNADGKPRPLVTSPHFNFGPAFSPDGKWLAYSSNEKGRLRVYVSPYAEPDVKRLISGKEGGMFPLWSPDGSEVFYRAGDKLMVVSVQTTPTFSAGKPRVLFEASSGARATDFYGYDIFPDGQRFLIIKEAQKRQAQIHVVRDWFEELKRLAPNRAAGMLLP